VRKKATERIQVSKLKPHIKQMNSTLVSLIVIVSISLVAWVLAEAARLFDRKMGISSDRHA
jgi:hypothetical protein